MDIPKVVGDVLRVVAPTVLTAIGGPFGSIASVLVVKAIDEFLPGSAPSPTPEQATPQDVVTAVQDNISDPSLIAALRKAEQDLKDQERELGFRYADLEQKDRADARRASVEGGLGPSIFRLGVTVLIGDGFLAGLIILGGFFLLSGAVQLNADPSVVTVIFTLIGAVLGRISSRADQVTNFYFGSSHGSKDKQDDLSIAVRDMGQALSSAPRRPAEALPAPPAVVVAPEATQAVVQASTEPLAPIQAPAPVQVRQSRFADLVGRVVDLEGGYSDHPADKGGPTKYGVTIRTLGDWRHGTVSPDDVKGLTTDEAKAIYHARYWAPLRCDNMPPGLDFMLFDFGVNAGVRRAATILQQVLAHHDPSLKVDGIIGPLTVAAATKVPSSKVMDEFHAAKMVFYQSLETWPTFGRGWTKRANTVLAEAKGDLSTVA